MLIGQIIAAAVIIYCIERFSDAIENQIDIRMNPVRDAKEMEEQITTMES